MIVQVHKMMVAVKGMRKGQNRWLTIMVVVNLYLVLNDKQGT